MPLREDIKKKEYSIGSWITIPHPTIIDVMASGKFDWLAIDMEHTSIDFKDAEVLISTMRGHNIPSLVRVGAHDELMIKKVLDSGADGIIAPFISSKSDVEKIIDFMFYPPNGKRGVGLYRAQNYGFRFNEYIQESKDLVFVAQLETQTSLENIDEICSVERIDAFIIGPYDLSASLGYPGEFDHPVVVDAVATLINKAISKNKKIGFHVIDPIPQDFLNKVGAKCNFLAYSLDFKFIAYNVAKDMEYIRRETRS